MIVDCISDLHGCYPELERGDLLIVAGDLTDRDEPIRYKLFFDWLVKQKYGCKILVAGNHDNYLEKTRMKGEISKHLGRQYDENNNLIGYGYYYLCDSGTEFEGLKIWGSPWTRKFEGQNPNCMAFALETEEELAEKFALIPKDTGILITHTPPHGILDQLVNRDPLVNSYYAGIRKKRVGSTALYDLLYKEHLRPKLCVFGHIHEGYGHIPKMMDMPGVQFVNASHMNEIYEPVNKPIRIIL